ncbi:hypothetical protein EK904_007776 [Melospiza melodia maxima]|nr:hypothetical protein EK904_007776 [Melospiza melodia maxima]
MEVEDKLLQGLRLLSSSCRCPEEDLHRGTPFYTLEIRSEQSSWILEKPDERCHSKPTDREGRGVIVLTCDAN